MTATGPTAVPGPLAVPDPPATPKRQWPEIVDGWVRSPEIRRDALRGVGMVLVAGLIALAMVVASGQFAIVWGWLCSTLPGRIVGAGLLASATGGLMLRRVVRRRRHAR